MSILAFKDISIEQSTPNSSLFAGTSRLVLSVSSSERVFGTIILLSHNSSPVTWNTDESLFLGDVATVTAEFTASVWTEVAENECRLVGFIGFSGPELLEMRGTECEIPLIATEGWPSLLLKTAVTALANGGKPLSTLEQRDMSTLYGEDTVEQIRDDAIAAYKDFERHGNLESLERAISQMKSLTTIIPQDDVEIPGLFNNLGIFLSRRFERLGHIADLTDAIIQIQTAIDLNTDDLIEKAMYLNNLGNCFMRRFERLGEISDIDTAIVHLQDGATLTPDGHTNKPMYLNNLGHSLMRRFERVGSIFDIDMAIAQQEHAAELIPRNDPDRFMYLSTLGGSLCRRFERLGNIPDIDQAIVHIETAIESLPKGHPKVSALLNDVGVCLLSRFEHFKIAADIDKAIARQQEAVNLFPDGHPDKHVCLCDLGLSLSSRFERYGDIADIHQAIVQQQDAVDTVPSDHPNRPMYLNNLGNSLLGRFGRLHEKCDVDRAIVVQKEAVDLTPDDHPNKHIYLSGLGGSLSGRFSEFRDRSDIEDAIKHQQVAIELIQDSHPKRFAYVKNLGISFLTRFRLGHQEADADAAISYLSSSAMTPIGSPTERFRSAEMWIRIATTTKHASLLDAYECALTLMPLVAWFGLSISSRHQHLVEMSETARDAAAAAISLGEYEKALEWLEQGRSIVKTQTLRLRTPVDQLRQVVPDLADRLSRTARQLDRVSEPNSITKETLRSVDEEGKQYRALAMEWEAIVEQIRAIPNFENFLKPIRSSQLMKAAQDGPVVVFNIAEERCDALAIVPELEDIIHIPLPDITLERVTELQYELKTLLLSSGMRMRGERAAKRIEEETKDKSCMHILAELWNGLVQPVLDSLAFSPNPDELPRIWWCATGPLSFLPIHAAGIYEPGSLDSQLSDYAISSYIPTISTLLESHDRPMSPPLKLLSVIQPSAPGASAIPNTKDELDCIRRHIGDRKLFVLEGREGTRKRVMAAMENCNWVHLACHGVQKLEDPTKSALILEDGNLTLDQITSLNLPKAEFAFLSACQTTTGDEDLSEEAVHIAGGMLLAGFRGVVATMWSIQDELAPQVTDDFYAHLMKNKGRPDYKKAAEALHLSIQKLRKNANIPLTAWIPFVHLGA